MVQMSEMAEAVHYWHNVPVMTDKYEPEVARRLRILRIAEEPVQSRFCSGLGISPSRWNNFEAGTPLSKEVAFQLVRKVPGLTLDWLWLGIESGLTVELRRRLNAAATHPDVLAGRRRRTVPPLPPKIVPPIASPKRGRAARR